MTVDQWWPVAVAVAALVLALAYALIRQSYRTAKVAKQNDAYHRALLRTLDTGHRTQGTLLENNTVLTRAVEALSNPLIGEHESSAVAQTELSGDGIRQDYPPSYHPHSDPLEDADVVPDPSTPSWYNSACACPCCRLLANRSEMR